MRRLFSLVVCVMMLVSCGGSPAAEPAAEPTTGSVAAAPTSQPTAPAAPEAATSAPEEATPAGEATEEVAEPDATATGDATDAEATPLPEELSFRALVLVQGAVAMIDELAQQVVTNDLDESDILAQRMVISSLLNVAVDELAKPAPLDSIEAEWESTKADVTKLQDITKRWSDEEIASDEVLKALEPIQSNVDENVSSAETTLAEQFGESVETIRAEREKAIEELRKEISDGLAPAAGGTATAEETPAADGTDPAVTAEPAETTAAEATNTAAGEEPATAGTDVAGGSRATPLMLNTAVPFESWTVTVTQVLRGEEAQSAISGANQFNEAAPEGYEYILATLQIANTSDKTEPQNPDFAIQIGITGDNDVVYPRAALVTPKPFESQLLPGGVAEGQIGVAVPQGEGNLMFVLQDTLDFESGPRFVAIEATSTQTADAALDDIAATEIGATRETAAKLNETVTTDDWEITVTEVVRGADAATRIVEANQYNDPAPAGSEYVLVKARVRYIGTESGETPERVDNSFFKATGEKNVVYDAPALVKPAPALELALFPGGQTEGWVGVTVDEGEQGIMVVFQPLFSLDSSDARYISLQ